MVLCVIWGSLLYINCLSTLTTVLIVSEMVLVSPKFPSRSSQSVAAIISLDEWGGHFRMKRMNNKGVVVPTPLFFSVIFHDTYKKEWGKKACYQIYQRHADNSCLWILMNVTSAAALLCCVNSVLYIDMTVRKLLQSLSWNFPSHSFA